MIYDLVYLVTEDFFIFFFCGPRAFLYFRHSSNGMAYGSKPRTGLLGGGSALHFRRRGPSRGGGAGVECRCQAVETELIERVLDHRHQLPDERVVHEFRDWDLVGGFLIRSKRGLKVPPSASVMKGNDPFERRTPLGGCFRQLCSSPLEYIRGVQHLLGDGHLRRLIPRRWVSRGRLVCPPKTSVQAASRVDKGPDGRILECDLQLHGGTAPVELLLSELCLPRGDTMELLDELDQALARGLPPLLPLLGSGVLSGLKTLDFCQSRVSLLRG